MPLSENKFIRKAWDYYYNYVFWPKFNDKDGSKHAIALPLKLMV